jgi:acyl-CoA synthetase (AMP-forming)/AMP-acid ligase II
VHSMGSLLAGVGNMAHLLSFTAQDAAFLVSPLASITGVMQLHLALDRGGRLILEDAFSPPASLGRLIAHRVTVFGGAPFVLEQLLREAGRQRLESLPLRAVAVGGSAIPRRLLEEAATRYGIVPTRVYGSSECPNAFGSAPQDPLPQRLSDEGVAMEGTEGRLDEATGELQVRGDNLFRGYLDPQDNEEAFTPDGWFRTGDQATFTAGRLVITGRLKEVVARKGMKISLAEIDEAMRGMPDGIDAAAYGVSDANTGERVAVAVHVAPGIEVTLDGVTGWLRAAGLATYKLPEQLVIWHDQLPRTPSGKVIRRALADGAVDRPTHCAARLLAR